eukprot:2378381-Rhodomonas_salina.1
MQSRKAVPEATAEQRLPAKVPDLSAPLQPASDDAPPQESHMSGYSSGFPPDFFETALQHARPLAGYHLAEMWVRFTEARLTVLQARSVSASRAKQIQALTTALSSAQTRAREAEEAAAKAQSKFVEAIRALLKAQAETLDAEKEFGDVLEEIQSDLSFYLEPPVHHAGHDRHAQT